MILVNSGKKRLMKHILVDTCIWVDFFKDSDTDLSDRLENLISEDKVLLSDVVRSELLIGARDKKELEELSSVLDGLNVAEINSKTFIKAGELGFLMRREGFTLPLSDLIITAQAINHESQIWTYDKHFSTLEKTLEIDFLY